MLVRVIYFVMSACGSTSGRSATFGDAASQERITFRFEFPFTQELSVDQIVSGLRNHINSVLPSANGKTETYSRALEAVSVDQLLFAYPQVSGRQFYFRPPGGQRKGAG